MASSLAHTDSSRKRILVVDDDPSTRLLCATALRKAGYAVLEAEGSSEAMAVYAASPEPIHLLLIDIFLPPPDFQLSSGKTTYPRVHGHDLVLQARSLGKELRVLFMSSHTLTQLQAEGIPIDPTRFLHKPFSVAHLQGCVAMALAAAPLPLDTLPSASGSTEVPWFD
jgi:CheY-like chemotaxis protein